MELNSILEKSQSGPMKIATVQYTALDYQDIHPDGVVNAPSREEMMTEAVRGKRKGEVYYCTF